MKKSWKQALKTYSYQVNKVFEQKDNLMQQAILINPQDCNKKRSGTYFQFKKGQNIQNTDIHKNRTQRLLLLENIDLDQIPGDFKIAEEHFHSSEVKRELEISEAKNGINFCKCCGRQVQRQALPLCCKNSDFAFIGAGYPSFFELIKNCIKILFIYFSISGIFSIIINQKYGTDCKDQEFFLKQGKDSVLTDCSKNWITIFSIGNIKSRYDLVEIQQILHIASTLIVVIYFQFLRRKQRIIAERSDENDISASDYTVRIDNLQYMRYQHTLNIFFSVIKFRMKNKSSVFGNPNNTALIQCLFILYIKKIISHIEKEDFVQFLQNELENKLLDRKVEIKHLIFSYDQSFFSQLLKQKDHLITQKQRLLSNKLSTQAQIDIINTAIKSIKLEILQWSRKFYNPTNSIIKQYSSKTVFAQFNIAKDQKDVVKKYKKLTYNLEGHQLYISQAPDPSDIHWNNLGLDQNLLHRRIFIGLIMVIIIIVAAGSIVYGIAYGQKQYILANKEVDSNAVIISISLSLFITINNFFLESCLQQISIFIRYDTITKTLVTSAKGIAILEFINTGISPYVLQVLVYESQFYGRIFGPSGLILNVNNLFITHTIFSFLVQVIDPVSIIFKYFKKNEKAKGIFSLLTQQELNTLYEKKEYLITCHSAYVINTMFMTMFYAALMPICIAYSIVGLHLNYFISKYNLLRRKQVKSHLDASFTLQIIDLLELIVPIYCFANIIFISYLIHDLYAINYVGLVIGILLVIMPSQKINEFIFKVKQAQINEETLDQAQSKFNTDYGLENPIIRQAYLEERRNYLNKFMTVDRLTKNVKKMQLLKKFCNLVMKAAKKCREEQFNKNMPQDLILQRCQTQKPQIQIINFNQQDQQLHSMEEEEEEEQSDQISNNVERAKSKQMDFSLPLKQFHSIQNPVVEDQEKDNNQNFLIKLQKQNSYDSIQANEVPKSYPVLHNIQNQIKDHINLEVQASKSQSTCIVNQQIQTNNNLKIKSQTYSTDEIIIFSFEDTNVNQQSKQDLSKKSKQTKNKNESQNTVKSEFNRLSKDFFDFKDEQISNYYEEEEIIQFSINSSPSSRKTTKDGNEISQSQLQNLPKNKKQKTSSQENIKSLIFNQLNILNHEQQLSCQQPKQIQEQSNLIIDKNSIFVENSVQKSQIIPSLSQIQNRIKNEIELIQLDSENSIDQPNNNDVFFTARREDDSLID